MQVERTRKRFVLSGFEAGAVGQTATRWYPQAFQPGSLTRRPCPPAGRHAWRTDAFPSTASRSGPYTIAEWVPRDHVTLAQWEGYQRRAPWSDHTGPAFPERITWKIIPDQGTRMVTLASGETQMTWMLIPPDVAHMQGGFNRPSQHRVD
jgi:ABC-type transport system substrate-binding protein